MKWKCNICGWIYDEDSGLSDAGINPGTKWEDVDDDFRCPKCGAQKKWFQQTD